MSTENSAMHREAFDLLCGDFIGRGMSRSVFACKLLPDCIVKVEEVAGQFQNIVEWETWKRVADTPYSRWFAQCRWISPNGSVLIMERTRPPAPDEFPAKVPVFLTDLKRTNYGMATSNGAKSWLVCHDYGTSLLFEHGMSKRLKKADWFDAAP